MNARFWWTNLKDKDDMEGLDVHGRIILKWSLNKQDDKTQTGLIWLWAEISSGLL
jgi:hypothetical protein